MKLRNAVLASCCAGAALLAAGARAQAVSKVTLTPSSVVGGAGASCAVTLTKAAPSGGFSVKLSSTSTSVKVVATLKVPAGDTSADIPVTTSPVAANTTGTITATGGGASKTAVLTVLAPTLSSLTFVPSPVYGGKTSGGTITLSGEAPSGGCSISLKSTEASAQVPASVVVKAGTKSAIFTVTTTPVAKDTTATITATLGKSIAAVKLTVDAPAVAAVSMSPATVYAGYGTTGFVTLSSPAPTGGISYPLSSSSSLATLPPSISIVAGKTSGSFAISTKVSSVGATATIKAGTASTSLGIAGVGLSPNAPWPKYHANNQNTATGASAGTTGGLVSTFSVYGGDSPAVIGPDGTVYIASDEVDAMAPNPANSWSTGLTYKGAPIYPTNNASPALAANGDLYVAANYVLFALDSSGNVKWSFPTESTNGIFSSPAIASDGTIYFGGADGYLYALKPDGTKKWSYKPPATSFLQSAPALASNGTVYLLGDSGGTATDLYALSPTGARLWTVSIPSDNTGAFSSPAVAASGTIYLTIDYVSINKTEYSKLIAVSPAGKIMWSYALPSNATFGFASPTVASNGTVYVVDSFGYLRSFTSAGVENWSVQAPNGPFAVTNPTVGSDGTIYLASTSAKNPQQAYYCAIAPSNGSVKWQVAEPTLAETAGYVPGPVIDGAGHIYFFIRPYYSAQLKVSIFK